MNESESNAIKESALSDSSYRAQYSIITKYLTNQADDDKRMSETMMRYPENRPMDRQHLNRVGDGMKTRSGTRAQRRRRRQSMLNASMQPFRLMLLLLLLLLLLLGRESNANHSGFSPSKLLLKKGTPQQSSSSSSSSSDPHEEKNAPSTTLAAFSMSPSQSNPRRTFLGHHHRRRSLGVIRGGAAFGRSRASSNGGTTKTSGATPTAAAKVTTPPSSKPPREPTQKENPRVMALIRVLFLLYYGSLGALMPYLPVYYMSLGHGGQIIGLLGAVKPFTTFLVAPLWGLVSDMLQQPFLILNVTFLVSAAGQTLVAFRSEALYIMVMVFITALFNAPVKSLLDSMVMEQLHDQSSYGRLRLWGQMGFGVGSSLTGSLLSRSKDIPWPDETTFSLEFAERLANYPVALQRMVTYADKCWQSLSGYKLLFLAYIGLSVPTFLGMQAFKRMSHKPVNTVTPPVVESTTKNNKNGKTPPMKKKSTIQELSLLVHNTDALLFFFLVFVVGVSSGMIENFAYVRIREVGGTGKEMGLSRLVSSIAGAPMFWFSGPLARNLGVDRILVLTLSSYATRFAIYAVMQRAYQGLPAEALRGVTFAAFWSSATIYAHKVSPAGLHATMLMMMNAMYGGLGQSLGAIIGGRLQHRFGTVQSFWYGAAFDTAFVCALVAYLSLRKESNFRNPQPIDLPKPKKKQS